MNTNPKYLLLLLPFLLACEKEISVDLPPVEPKLVVEGFIEQGLPPVVQLTESRGFFDEVDSASLSEIAVTDAKVFVSVDGQEFELTYFPFGVYGVYSSTNFSGVVGKTYELRIEWGGKSYSADTYIPAPVPVDSLRFEVETEGDSLGFIWATMNEPAGEGDAYRWFAQRLGKDPAPIPPLGSAFDDKFIDGKEFSFAFYRGMLQNSTAPDDNNRERGYFKEGDTVIVRFCHIEHEVYDFIYTYEIESAGSGNPFAAPTTVKTNIEGGALGYWGGYGAFYDTLICKSN